MVTLVRREDSNVRVDPVTERIRTHFDRAAYCRASWQRSAASDISCPLSWDEIDQYGAKVFDYIIATGDPGEIGGIGSR
ncbi:MAG: hypothetical protein ACLPVY_25195 [Acidimicrobiia bacterium]